MQEWQGLLWIRKKGGQRRDRNKFWLLLCSESAFTSPVLHSAYICLPAQTGHVSKACVREDHCQARLLQGESFRDHKHCMTSQTNTRPKKFHLGARRCEAWRDPLLGHKTAICGYLHFLTRKTTLRKNCLLSTVNLAVVPVQTDSFAWRKRNITIQMFFVLTTEPKMPSDPK